MIKLFLGDVYDQGFKSRFGITKDNIFSTYNEPDSFQDLEVGVRLSIKRLDNQKQKSYLLLCTQRKDNYCLFGFSYWIPEKLISSSKSLDTLQAFADLFGFKVKVGNKEDKFIFKAKVLLNSKLLNPFQLVEVLDSDDIPYHQYMFYDEFVVSKTLVVVDAYYVFAINNNKYLTWLNEMGTVRIKVPEEWVDNLSRLVERLEPNGQTKLKIWKSKRINPTQEEAESRKMTEADIPARYSKQLSHIVSLLNNNENITVIPSFSSPVCLFCQNSNTSQEHIFPKWLRNFLVRKISTLSFF